MSSNYHIKFSDFLKFIQSLPHRKINSKQNTVATKTSNDYITQNTAIILYYKTDFFPFYLNLLRYASNQNNLYQKYEKKIIHSHFITNECTRSNQNSNFISDIYPNY